MMTLTVAALTWIVSESSRLVIDRNIPADKQTPITLGIIVMIVLLLILASHFNVNSEHSTSRSTHLDKKIRKN